MRLSNTRLYNATSNGLSFTSLEYVPTYVFSDPGTIGSNAARYFYPSGNVSSTPVSYRIFKPTIIKNLIVNARIAPTTGRTSTLTVYKNNVATTLTTTLSGNAVTGENTTVAVSFVPGDTFEVVHTGTNNSALADVIIQLEMGS
jgi:hypothetical protein